MRMRIYFLLTFIFLYNLYSQGDVTRSIGKVNINYLPQAFLVQSLGSFGYSNTTLINAYNIGNSNPASLSTFESWTVGLSYQLESKIDQAWINDERVEGTYIGHEKIYSYLPQSLGLIVPIRDFEIGVAYDQIYNSSLLYKPMTLLLITPENPEGTLETFKYKSETLITEFSFLTTYDFKHLFSKNDGFSIGVKFGIVNTNQYNKILSTEYKENYSGITWSIGCLYQASKERNAFLNLGLFYDNSFSKEAKYDEALFEIDNQLTTSKYYYVTNLPSKLHFGVSGIIKDRLQYSSNISYIFWESVTSNSFNNKNLENQVEISGNLNYSITTMIASSIGVFSTNRKFKEKPTNNFVDEFSSVFLIFGITTYFKNFDLSLIVADSHLFSDELRKQTIFKIGTNLSFN